MTSNNEFEKHIALQESHYIKNSDDYFNARPQIGGSDRRKVFEAGHKRGYTAARAESEKELAGLQEQLKIQHIDLDRLITALERLAKLGNEPNYGNSVGNMIAIEALSHGVPKLNEVN